MTFDEWKKRFCDARSKNRDIEDAWTYFQQKGCRKDVLELALWRIGRQKRTMRLQIVYDKRRRIRDHLLASDIRKMVRSISLHQNRYAGRIHSQIIEAQGLLAQLASELEFQADKSYFSRQDFDLNLPLLASYVKRKTGDKDYERLAHLVRYALGQPVHKYEPGSLGTTILRYAKAYPRLWMSLNRIVDEYTQLSHQQPAQALFDFVTKTFASLASTGHIVPPKKVGIVRDKQAQKKYLRDHGPTEVDGTEQAIAASVRRIEEYFSARRQRVTPKSRKRESN